MTGERTEARYEVRLALEDNAQSVICIRAENGSDALAQAMAIPGVYAAYIVGPKTGDVP